MDEKAETEEMSAKLETERLPSHSEVLLLLLLSSVRNEEEHAWRRCDENLYPSPLNSRVSC